MALLNSISSANLVVEQGDTYQFHVEPAVTTTGIARSQSGNSTMYYDKTEVKQWKGEVIYSKRYRYVGLSADSIASLCNTCRTYYSKTFDKWAVGLATIGSGSSARALYCYVKVGTNAPMMCASVTPVHVEGAMWEIEVDVNATVEYYSDPVVTGSPTPPSGTILMGLVSSITGYPG